MTYYFDMDGTIANLYGVKDWLKYLIKEDTYPYDVATPMVDIEKFIESIYRLKQNGVKFGIISWTSKGGSKSYNRAVRNAKIQWLRRYFPGCFDEIHIVKYGTPKHGVAKDKGILFDDEEQNRTRWNRGLAFDEHHIERLMF